MKPNYEYPLDMDWTKDEMVQAVTFYELVEDAYEGGTNRDNLLAAYAGFKQVVPDKGTEKRYDRMFKDQSGYSFYHAVKQARESDERRIRVEMKHYE